MMNVSQAFIATLISYACIFFLGSKFQRVGSIWDLAPASICHTIASPIGYLAMRYIDFPLYIVVSSCKLIPVLLVGVLVNRGARPLQDYLSAILMSEGVMLWMLIPNTVNSSSGHGGEISKPEDNFLGISLSPLGSVFVGVFLTASNLFLEGFTNASQDRVNILNKAAGRRSVPSLQMMAE